MRKIYIIDCSNLNCSDCGLYKYHSRDMCEFKGTKKQVERFIKRSCKQPKIKELKISKNWYD